MLLSPLGGRLIRLRAVLFDSGGGDSLQNYSTDFTIVPVEEGGK